MSVQTNLDIILKSHESGIGWDVVVISTATPKCYEFWQKRFQQFKHTILPSHVKILVVVEDFGKNGAGNGLGTLYAWKQAVLKAKNEGWDLTEKLKNGAAVALFHTAGMGTRVYPLTAAEGGIKPAIRLPSLIQSAGKKDLLTLLEAIIKQTSLYAASNQGRLSVFWGDQIFIPSKPIDRKIASPIELFVRVSEIPTQSDWQKERYHQYGLVGLQGEQMVAILEKCNFEAFQNLMNDKTSPSMTAVAKSLGSFTLSALALHELIEAFNTELEEKQGKFDTDSDFWMPILLSKEMYLETLKSKPILKDRAVQHFERMQKVKQRLLKTHPDKSLFGVIDVGNMAYWWDYGTLANYFQNNMLLIGSSDEAAAMRHFFSLTLDPVNRSCLQGEEGQTFELTESVVIGVKAENLKASHSLILGGEFKTLTANRSLAYKAVIDGEVHLSEGEALTTVSFKGDQEQAKSLIESDPKKDWSCRLFQNSHSWEEYSEFFE